MTIFSNRTLTILSRSGWSTDYIYDTTQYENFYSAAGCRPPEIVKRFIQRFGGLVIHEPIEDTQGVGTISLGLSHVSKAFLHVLCHDNDEIARRIGAGLLPMYIVGATEHLELLMTVEGAVYGVRDDYLVFLGSDGESAIETLCSQRQYIEIP